MSPIPTFESDEPSDEPKDFAITGWRWAGEEREKVTATFQARTDVSYGLLLQEVDALESGGGSVYGVFRKVLVEENTAPDGEDDTRAEFDRFHDFVAAEDVFVSQRALLGALRWIAGEQADRPTGSSGGSRSTRRAAGRGSAGTRRR